MRVYTVHIHTLLLQLSISTVDVSLLTHFGQMSLKSLCLHLQLLKWWHIFMFLVFRLSLDIQTVVLCNVTFSLPVFARGWISRSCDAAVCYALCPFQLVKWEVKHIISAWPMISANIFTIFGIRRFFANNQWNEFSLMRAPLALMQLSLGCVTTTSHLQYSPQWTKISVGVCFILQKWKDFHSVLKQSVYCTQSNSRYSEFCHPIKVFPAIE